MKPIIAITMGDFNGIGPEVTLKSILSPKIRNLCLPLLIGSIDVYDYYAQRLKMKIHLKEIDKIPSIFSTKHIPVFHIRKFQKPIIKPEKISKEAGEFGREAIEIAADLCKQEIVDGMVTAPVSKESMHLAGFRYPGQTEMLAKLCNTSNVVMMLIAKDLRVGLATIHLPLKKVAKEISQKNLIQKLSIIHQSLQRDFNIRNLDESSRRPRIAVLGLNPHAGENGNIGNEENIIIVPAIQSMKRRGIITDGPFAADGFMGTHAYKKYDAIFAMYHDQGLIPLKMLGFDIGVNYTAGLPIVRTSPDHGTAFEIAGKGIANPSSMIEAIKLAVQIIHNRRKK
ncbi:MAG: 4-hydroxythreonine-4-phosphate dehydrogenase PdxA [Bacteroidota bacterium]|nr:4-hydroxythreonine-4-phosphate dehydrogenase PdxA [Bacteroidota bacterium]